MAVDYVLKRNRRSRSMRVRVDVDGEVMVSAPYGVPKLMISRFVNKSEPWIRKQQRKIALKKTAYPTLDWEQMLLSYLGKLYQIKFDPERKEKVSVGRRYVYVSPVTGLEADLKRTLLRWLKLEAEKDIFDRVTKWSNKMEVKYAKVRFRQQKSRWGSCSNKGTLSFNWRLIHFSPDVIDYVVIHELAHLKHHDHSKEYWELVRKFDRDYKRKIRFLKQQVVRIEKV